MINVQSQQLQFNVNEKEQDRKEKYIAIARL